MKYLLLIALFLVFSSVPRAQIFTDVTESYGIDNYCNSSYGNGVSAYDWNNDGWDDLVLLRNEHIPQFYENNHNGFTEVFFTGVTEDIDPTSVCWVDFDNDGNLDLSINSLQNGMSLFHRTGPYSFEDITESANVVKHPGIEWGYGQAWGDFDKDGDLDFYHCNYNNEAVSGQNVYNRLYRNNGDLTFRDITLFAGLDTSLETSFLPVWIDYDNDTWPDLFVVNDKDNFSNHMYRNNTDGTFTDVTAETGMDYYIDAMSGTFGDFNNDEFFDLYMTNSYQIGNILLENGDGIHFDNVSGQNNVQFFQWCWSSSWIDYDCDGLQDLFVSMAPAWQFSMEGNHFLLHNEQQSFSLNWNSGFGNGQSQTFSAARADFNNDGYPDIVTHSELPQKTQIWINNATNAGNWLKVLPVATASNPQAVGVLIQAHTGSTVQSRYTFIGEQYLAQNSMWQFFGFGDTETIDSLVLSWPSGQRDVLYDVTVNQTLQVTEGFPIASEISFVYGGISFCEGDSVVLDAGEFDSYLWQDNSTNRFLTVSQTDSVSVMVSTNGSFQILPPVLITMIPSPVTGFSFTDMICEGTSTGFAELQLTSEDDINSIQWSSGVQGTLISDLSPGLYNVVVNYGPGCSVDYEFEITEFPPFSIDSILIFQTSGVIGCQSQWAATAMHSGGDGEVTKYWQVFETGSSVPILEHTGDTLDCLPDIMLMDIACSISDEAGCADTLIVSKEIPLSFEHSFEQIRIFPNPGVGEFWIAGLSAGEHRINVFDLTGRVVQSNILTANQNYFNMVGLAAGCYRVLIENEVSSYSLNLLKH
ncbi:MAG: VCBS repeat-containing protein [Bacteroidetes bacterium]|nr:VCBS repeat-containing protein [Bacteroidota bacterium]